MQSINHSAGRHSGARGGLFGLASGHGCGNDVQFHLVIYIYIYVQGLSLPEIGSQSLSADLHSYRVNYMKAI